MLAPWQRLAPGMQEMQKLVQALQMQSQGLPSGIPQPLPQSLPKTRPEQPERTNLGTGTWPAFRLAPPTMPGPAGAGGLPSPLAPLQAGIPGGSPLLPQLAQAAQVAQAPALSNMQQFQQALSMIGQAQGPAMGPAPATPSNQQPGLNNLGLAQILGSAGAAIAEPGTWQSRLGAAGAQTAQTLQQRQDLLAQQARQEQMDKAQLANQNENQNLAKMQLAASLQDKLKPFEQELAETEQLALAKNPWLKVPRGGSAIPVSPMASAMTGGQPILGQPGAESRGAYTLYQGTDGQVYSADQLRQMEQAEMPLPAIVSKVGTARSGADNTLQKVGEGQGLWDTTKDAWELPPVPRTSASSRQEPTQFERKKVFMSNARAKINDFVARRKEAGLKASGNGMKFQVPNDAELDEYVQDMYDMAEAQYLDSLGKGETPKDFVPIGFDEWKQLMNGAAAKEQQMQESQQSKPSTNKFKKAWNDLFGG